MAADFERAYFFFYTFAIKVGVRAPCLSIELERYLDVWHFLLEFDSLYAAVFVKQIVT